MTDSKRPSRPCEHGEGAAHNPLGPLRPGLTFEQMQAVSAKLGQALSCSMCGHRFPPDATTAAHECKQPMFKQEVFEVKPMPEPAGFLFYLNYPRESKP